jgi:hypothetical protein
MQKKMTYITYIHDTYQADSVNTRCNFLSKWTEKSAQFLIKCSNK